jgi:hypothetical protein
MSGLATAATIAAIGSAAVGAGTLGYSIYAGNKASGQQQQALKQQNTAQQTATAASLSNERKSEVAQGAANQQAPDIAGILQRAATVGTGLSSTMLTGASGVNPSGLSLGSASLLGK